MLLRSCGRYTDLQLQRCARLSGAFGKQTDWFLTEGGLGDLVPSKNTAKKSACNKDVLDFVKEFQKDALFDYHPGRQHCGFEVYINDSCLRSPNLLGRKLRGGHGYVEKNNQIEVRTCIQNL